MENLADYEEFAEIFEKHFSREALELLSDKEEFSKWLERMRWHTRKFDELGRELQAFKDKREQGLQIELPCKMNDEFFVIAYSSRKVTHVRCTGYCVQEDGQTGRKEAFVWIDSLENNRDYWKLSLDDFKTQCFATEAEAEEALAKMGGNA